MLWVKYKAKSGWGWSWVSLWISEVYICGICMFFYFIFMFRSLFGIRNKKKFLFFECVQIHIFNVLTEYIHAEN